MDLTKHFKATHLHKTREQLSLNINSIDNTLKKLKDDQKGVLRLVIYTDNMAHRNAIDCEVSEHEELSPLPHTDLIIGYLKSLRESLVKRRESINIEFDEL